MEPKAWVFGRLWQSFTLLKGSFFKLSLPIFVFQLIFVVIVWAIGLMFFFLMSESLNLLSTDPLSVYNDPTVIIAIAVWILLFLLYLILYIPVTLGLLKWIKQSINWEKITILKNISFWFSRLFKAFKTYWFVFAYVALIPALFFIWGWLLTIIWMLLSNNILLMIWWALTWISGILFIAFSIYRGIKSVFAMFSAVDNDQFTKANFLESVKITDNNWWRIVWNLLVIWILVWVIMMVLSILLSSLMFSETMIFVYFFFLIVIKIVIMILIKTFLYLFFIALRMELKWETVWSKDASKLSNNKIEKEREL